VVDEVFRLAGIAPAHRRALPAATSFRLDATFYLDVLFTLVAVALWWLARNQQLLGGGETVARDPVCGMQVEIASAAASMIHRGDPVYFCSDHCRIRFAGDPERYASRAEPDGRLTPEGTHHGHGTASL
jgi:YHS domain-containing protein